MGRNLFLPRLLVLHNLRNLRFHDPEEELSFQSGARHTCLGEVPEGVSRRWGSILEEGEGWYWFCITGATMLICGEALRQVALCHVRDCVTLTDLENKDIDGLIQW
ncbi:hypothetical protein ACFE04_021769 [Oxalis oulophora]